MDKPLVSVVMSVHNGEKTVLRSLNSIANQTYKNIEFIVVENGSTDNTHDIIVKFTRDHDQKDMKMVVAFNKQKRCLSDALNQGIELARGKYIARTDADDISHPNRVAIQVEYMEKNQDVGVVGSDYIETDFRGQPTPRKMNPHSDAGIYQSLPKFNPIAHPTAMIRKKILDDHEIRYDPDFKVAQDYDLWVKMMPHCRLENLDVTLVMRTFIPDAKKMRLQDDESLKIRARLPQSYPFWWVGAKIKKHIPIAWREGIRRIMQK